MILHTADPNNFTFDNQRFYLDGEVFYPSVTTVLKGAGVGGNIEKYIQKAFDSYASEHGIKKATAFSKLPFLVGNYTHKCIEEYLLGVEGASKQIDRCLGKYIKTDVLQRIVEVVAVEYVVINKEFDYAGMVDAVVKLDDGSVVLMDWKTSRKAQTNSTVKKYNLQIAAYVSAFESQTGIKIDYAQICVMYRNRVRARSNSRVDFFKIDSDQLASDFLSFKELLTVF